jgi:flagellar protein FlgJ
VSRVERMSFIETIKPYARQAAEKLGVSADTLIAHAALETGWGRHLPAAADGASSCNLYGIKAGSGWQGAAVHAVTTEYTAGAAQRVPQSFRSYASLEQGMQDYVSLLQGNPRYQQALGTGSDVGAFASALARGGYATDPDYARKLCATAADVRALGVSA